MANRQYLSTTSAAEFPVTLVWYDNNHFLKSHPILSSHKLFSSGFRYKLPVEIIHNKQTSFFILVCVLWFRCLSQVGLWLCCEILTFDSTSFSQEATWILKHSCGSAMVIGTSIWNFLFCHKRNGDREHDKDQ